MIVMTTGLSGLVALMRREDRPAPTLDRSAPPRLGVGATSRVTAARRS